MKDINPDPASSNPASLVDVNGTLFFTAEGEGVGTELWKSDGSADGTRLVKDINPAGSSNPIALINVGGILFFTADDGVHGRELWRSDGTQDGTMLVKDLDPRTDPYSGPYDAVTLNGMLFLPVNDGEHGWELWRSDGSGPGTVMVRDIVPGSSGSFPVDLTPVGDTLFFRARTFDAGVELWRTDGTELGTVQVKDINPGPADSYEFSSFFAASPPVAVGGVLYFVADDGVHGVELWRSDGTEAGTALVKDVRPGPESSFPAHVFSASLTAFKGLLYFTADDGSHHDGLWRSDGSEIGTTLFKDLVGQPLWTQGLVVFNDALYFVSADQLWKSDGTELGTAPFDTRSAPDKVVVSGRNLFLSYVWMDDLWMTDGTAEGTRLVKSDLRPGDGSGYLRYATDVGGRLFFSVDDGEHGFELWLSDGTPQGTRLVRDIRGGTDDEFPLWSGYNAVNASGILYFSIMQSLWRSDGTPAGTVSLGTAVADELAHVGPTVFFDDVGLWRTESGAEQPTRLTDSSWVVNFTASNGDLFFQRLQERDQGRDQWQVWKTDGTPVGTVMLLDAEPVQPLVNVAGQVFAEVRNNVTNSLELWVTAGTPESTRLVARMYASQLAAVGGRLFFTSGSSLWKTDGTPSGTKFLKDFGAGIVLPGNLTDVGGTLFFSVDDGTHGVELWKSNGRRRGTVLVRDINLGQGSSSPTNLTDINRTLYFSAWDPEHGTELWRSDGTKDGTVLVSDIRPGADGSLPSHFTNVNGTVFFSASTAEWGNELWSSDGSQHGTVPVADIYPGAGGSNPDRLVDVNGALFFIADDGRSGRELYRLVGDRHLSYAVPPGGPSNLTLRRNDTDLELMDDAGTVVGRSVAADTRAVEIAAVDGQDHSLTLDFTTGQFSVTDGVTFTGGAGSDTVVVRGGSLTSIVHRLDRSGVGDISLDGFVVRYSGIEHIVQQTLSTLLEVRSDSVGTQLLLLHDDNVPDDGNSEVECNNADPWTLTFAAPTHSLVVAGGPGNDEIQIDHLDDRFAAALRVNGGDGNDRIDASQSSVAVTLIGGAGFDSLVGSAGGDVVQGGSGSDSLDGGAGNDSLSGDQGDDLILGGAGHDTLVGGRGRDTLLGGAGRDQVIGGAGDDVLSGGKDNDALMGGMGNDQLSGQAGDDSLDGGDGSDSITGGMGSDTLAGRAGADYLFSDGFDQLLTDLFDTVHSVG